MTDDDEPTVTLLDGTAVLAAIHDLVLDLIASGHRIRIVGDGDAVHIEPRVADDVWACLDASWRDVEAILAVRGEKLQHQSPVTVH